MTDIYIYIYIVLWIVTHSGVFLMRRPRIEALLPDVEVAASFIPRSSLKIYAHIYSKTDSSRTSKCQDTNYPRASRSSRNRHKEIILHN